MGKYLNPEKKTWNERILTWFGDLKFFKFPPIIVYDPGSYKVNGEDTREVIDLIQKGDIVLRAYDNYIDGYVIPGRFSHVGFFYGSATERDRKSAGTTIDDNPEKLARVQKEEFKTGKQMMIHAMADGVFMEDVINFCRCDKMVILRLPDKLDQSKQYDDAVFKETVFLPSEEKIRQKLKQGEDVSRKDIVTAACKVVLSCLGARYDFRFDFKEEAHNSFSCSELAYYAYRSVDRYINLKPKTTCIMGICKKGITPDQFLDTGFELVWASRSVREEPDLKRRLAASG